MPTILVSDAYVLDSTNNALSFDVTLVGGGSETVTVSFLTHGGTATDGSDYSGVPNRVGPGTLQFLPGESSKTITILQNHAFENEPELDEFLRLELYNPRNADFGGGANSLTATGWITQGGDPDASRSIQVSKPVIVEGNDGRRTAEFRISLSQAFETDTELRFETLDGSARAGTDYERRAGPLDFGAGELEKVVSVPVLGDLDFETAETFHLAVRPAAGFADGAHGFVGTATILDGDAPDRLPTISVSRATGTEGFYNTVPFLVRLSEPSDEEVSVTFRTAGGTADAGGEYFTRASTVLTFLPGETSKLVDVDLQGDGEDEVDETVILELTNPENAILDGGVGRLREVGWILDDDNAGTTRQFAVADLQALERAPSGRGEAIFRVSLSEPSEERIRLDYRTVEGDAKARDFRAADGVLVFEPGQTEASVTVRLRQDYAREGGEQFALRLTVQDAGDFAPGTAGVSAVAEILDASIVGTDDGQRLQGTRFADAIFGLGGADTLVGGDGDDRLVSGPGNDRLLGGDGADELSPGTGRDRLRGDGGPDLFVLGSAREAGLGRTRDVIEDLERRDRIDLADIDANLRRDGDQRFDFIGRAAFSDKAGELRHRGGVLQADLDGNGKADFEIAVAAGFRLSEDSFLL